MHSSRERVILLDGLRRPGRPRSTFRGHSTRCESRRANARAMARPVLVAMRDEATAILEEDRAMCLRIGEAGVDLLKNGARVLTHCNAGALATGGLGTALAPVYVAAGRGQDVRVLATETRPLLQGSRLTAWELTRAGIPVTVITDGAAASRMRAGEVDLCIVGADRVVANGDVANKVGHVRARGAGPSSRNPVLCCDADFHDRPVARVWRPDHHRRTRSARGVHVRRSAYHRRMPPVWQCSLRRDCPPSLVPLSLLIGYCPSAVPLLNSAILHSAL